jgi:bifunctional enzyme CysN/CysC
MSIPLPKETYPLSDLDELEADAIQALREDPPGAVEVSSDLELACLTRLAAAAFAPAEAPTRVGRKPGARARALAGWRDTDVARYVAGEKTGADLLRVVMAGAVGRHLLKSFATERRRVIVTDVADPRDLVGAGARAELAVLVVDADTGLSPEVKRQGFICSLLGIPRVLVAVDNAGSRERFDGVRADFEAFAARLAFNSVTFLPAKAQTLRAHLEDVYIGGDRNLVDFRFGVQQVVHAGGRRWYLGRVASGVVKPGDEVVMLPGHRRSRVRALRLFERELEYAYAPLSVAVALDDDIEASRGALLAHARNVPRALRSLDAMVIWLDETPLAAGRLYQIDLGARRVRASCAEVNYRMDAQSLHRAGGHELGKDDIGRAAFTLFEECFVDPYAKNRATGRFTIVDADSGLTVGAGMIVDRASEPARVKPGEAARRIVIPHESKVTGADRAELLGQRAVTVWLTGLSGSGKSTLATELERRLMGEGRACYMLDGDNIRAGINRDLGFGPDDRRENIRRIAEVAKLMNDAGLITVTAFISPYRADRDMARAIIGAERFIEVYVDAPLEVCEGRDPKGLYRKARKGEIPEFTGITAPYEPPEAPALAVDTATRSLADCVDHLLTLLLSRAQP